MNRNERRERPGTRRTRTRLPLMAAAALAALTLVGRTARAQARVPEPAPRVVGALGVDSVPSVNPLSLGAVGSPIWTRYGRPTRQAVDAIRFLAHIDAKGLVPDDYQPGVLGREASALELNRPAADSDLIRFDSLMSAQVAHVVQDLHEGRVDPRLLGFNLPSPHDGLDLNAEVLRAASASDVAAEIGRVEPKYNGYVTLERALQRYRALAADSTLRPPAPIARPVRPGQHYADMTALRRLLVAFGDLDPDSAVTQAADSDRLAGPVVAALARFQRRHGLAPDSVLGVETVAALRIPVRDRVRQIELALERWRWLPTQPPDRYIVINIPAFRLYAFQHDATARAPVLAMDVIVGRSQGGHRTPVFAGAMREVVFRPYWDVPTRIARQELVPLLLRHPEDFGRDGYEIVRGDGDDAPVVAPSAANLRRVGAGEIRLRQRPGPANALGFVKFVFPNDYDVFLHGTPQRELFQRARRDFSHGCIRVEDPAGLAAFVLQDEPHWDAAAIDSAMNGARTLHVAVEPAVEVYVAYATVVTDTAATPTFYPDLYGRDRVLEAALHLHKYAPAAPERLRRATAAVAFAPSTSRPPSEP